MNEVLDDHLTTHKRPKSLYGKYSNIPAAIVILGALFKIMHWPYGGMMVLFGISGHFGIELGYAIALKFASKINNRRLLIASFFLVFMTGIWRLDFKDWALIDYSFILIILASIAITYILTKKKIKGNLCLILKLHAKLKNKI